MEDDSLPDFNSVGSQRRNSDPVYRENKIVMNGKNTVPKCRAPSYLKATGQDEKAPRTASPPPSRKNKFAASISRLFRPWKWRRKRKSDRFIATSENLERQLSVRAKREELVKKGILPAVSSSLPEASLVSMNNSVESETGSQIPSETPSQEGNLVLSACCPQKEASLKGILKSSPQAERAVKVRREFKIRQIDQSNMMDELSQNLASRISGSYMSQQDTNSDDGVRGQTNAQWTTVVNIQSADNAQDTDKENATPHVPPQLPMHHEDDESSEEEESGIITQLASKLKRTDSLALKLKVRPSKVELEEKNILHSRSEVQTQEQRAKVGSKLVRRLSSRPTALELKERNILKSSSEEEEKVDREEKKKVLTRKLSRRPTIQELKARKILKFSEYVESGECHDYDRRADKPWTRLTPEDKAAIRKELNEYKSAEMEVHEESRQYTRFHRP